MDVWSPELFGAGALLLDPGGDVVEDLSAEAPHFEVIGAADGELAALFGFAGGEDVPVAAFTGDGGVVGADDVAGELECLGLLLGDGEGGQ